MEPGREPIVVVGAGLAGLTAAIHVAERGQDVILLESHPDFLGGRTRGREPYRFDWNGVSHEHSFDHGQHCMWTQYWNMRHLLGRLGLDRNVRHCETTRYLVDDGTDVHRLRPFDVDPTRPPKSLLHFLAHLASATRVPGWSAADTARLATALPRLAVAWAFDHATSYEAWDRMSVHEMFAWIGLPPQMEEIFKSMCKASTFHPHTEISAAWGLSMMATTMIGDATDHKMSCFRGNLGTHLIDPLAAALRARGGRIIRNATAIGVEREGANITAVRIAPTAHRSGEAARTNGARSVEAARTNGALSVEAARTNGARPGFEAAMARSPGFEAATARSPGFETATARSNGRPHFASGSCDIATACSDDIAFGEVLDVPAWLRCSAVISATDIPGFKRWLLPSLADEPSIRGTSNLEAVGSVTTRVVTSRGIRPDDPWMGIFSGKFEALDTYFVLSRYQDEFIDFRARTGGEVIELHSYLMSRELEASSPETVRRLIEREVVRAWPELAGRIVHIESAANERTFDKQGVGHARFQPRMRTTVPNLVLCGSWIRVDDAVHDMEKAVVTGLRAANAVLEERGLEQFPVRSLRPPSSLQRMASIVTRRLPRPRGVA